MTPAWQRFAERLAHDSVLRERLRRMPVIGAALAGAAHLARVRTFPGSSAYWEGLYARGGGSGDGSRGILARFKADVLNAFVVDQNVESVIEFGCGDGEQLALARYPRYLGVDVSQSVLRRTIKRFRGDPSKSFLWYDPAHFVDPARFVTADLALSLDVIYHLVEDDIYHRHLRDVFGAARRFVVLYTSDADTLPVQERTAPHVRHRPVVRDVSARFPQWSLRVRIANRYPYRPGTVSSFADFFVYDRVHARPR